MRYPAYPNSTAPDLLPLPEGWKERRLKFVATCNDEVLAESTPPDYEISYVEISGVDLVEGLHTVEEMSFEKAPSRARRIARSGDTIVSTVRTYLRAIASIKSAPDNLVVSTGFAVLRPLSAINSAYLGYALQCSQFVQAVVANSTGVSYPAIAPTTLVTLPILYPTSASEQEHIANFLDWKTGQIDALITKKEALMSKVEAQRFAVVTKAVTESGNGALPMQDSGIEWLGPVPAHWTRNIKLGFLATQERNSFVNGPFGSDLLTTELVSDGVPVIYSGDVKANRFVRRSDKYITEEKACELNFCRVDAGDVLLAKVGDPPGDACVYPQGAPSAVVTQDVVRVRIDREKVDPQFLCYLLTSALGRHLVRQVSVEATRGRFSLADLRGLRMTIPPLDEQQCIVSKLRHQLEKFDEVVAVSRLAISRLAEYRAALITAATTGQIDVRGVAVPTVA